MTKYKIVIKNNHGEGLTTTLEPSDNGILVSIEELKEEYGCSVCCWEDEMTCCCCPTKCTNLNKWELR